MTITEASQLLETFHAGGISREKVLQAFQAAPVADIGFAQVDTHRALRKGFPEVIFCEGKTPEWFRNRAERPASSVRNGASRAVIRSARRLSQMTMTARFIVVAPSRQYERPGYSSLRARRKIDSAPEITRLTADITR